MNYQWDDTKCSKNVVSHKIHFSVVFKFNWGSAFVVQDERFDYKEKRFKALGLIENRLHVLVFTIRDQEIRVISIRKANKREISHYEKEKNQ